jgi:hypothetical protein
MNEQLHDRERDTGRHAFAIVRLLVHSSEQFGCR